MCSITRNYSDLTGFETLEMLNAVATQYKQDAEGAVAKMELANTKVEMVLSTISLKRASLNTDLKRSPMEVSRWVVAKRMFHHRF